MNSKSAKDIRALLPDIPEAKIKEMIVEWAAASSTKLLKASELKMKALEYAWMTGSALLEIKKRLRGSASYTDWCASNLPGISERTLQRYSKLAREVKRYEDLMSKFRSVRQAYLSLGMVKVSSKIRKKRLRLVSALRKAITNRENKTTLMELLTKLEASC